MKIYTIPIADERSQRLSVTLGRQEVDIVLTMRLGKLYIDVKANRVPVVSGRVCLNKEPIINESFRPFVGDCTSRIYREMMTLFSANWANVLF